MGLWGNKVLVEVKSVVQDMDFDGETLCRSCNRQMETGCGHLYVILDYHDGRARRVVAQLGKQGSCTRCQNDALAVAITVGLTHNVPISEYIESLRGYQCENPNMFPKNNRVLSCPDGIAKALEEIANAIGIKV